MQASFLIHRLIQESRCIALDLAHTFGLRCCLIADSDGVYDPDDPNGRLLLGLTGSISELELHTIRSRLTLAYCPKPNAANLRLCGQSG